MKSLLHIVWAMCLLFTVAACGDKTKTKVETPAEEPPQEEPPATDAGGAGGAAGTAGNAPDTGGTGGYAGCAESAPAEPPPAVIPAPPTRGVRCVTVLDQNDAALSGCTFDFEIEEAVLAEDEWYRETYGSSAGDAGAGGTGGAGGAAGTTSEAEAAADDFDSVTCAEGSLRIYGAPGFYQITAECGTLGGYIMVDLNEGMNDVHTTRLISSFCYANSTLMATTTYPYVHLDEVLRYSSATRCYYPILDDLAAEANVTVSPDFLLVCDDTTDCNPLSGRRYLEIVGKRGDYTNTHPAHLTLEASFETMVIGEEVTVMVRVSENGPYHQELDVPVLIRNSP